ALADVEARGVPQGIGEGQGLAGVELLPGDGRYGCQGIRQRHGGAGGGHHHQLVIAGVAGGRGAKGGNTEGDALVQKGWFHGKSSIEFKKTQGLREGYEWQTPIRDRQITTDKALRFIVAATAHRDDGIRHHQAGFGLVPARSAKAFTVAGAALVLSRAATSKKLPGRTTLPVYPVPDPPGEGGSSRHLMQGADCIGAVQ